MLTLSYFMKKEQQQPQIAIKTNNDKRIRSIHRCSYKTSNYW